MTLYAVTNNETGEARLVIAPSRAAAVKHVAAAMFTVEIPNAIEAARLSREGSVIEEAGVDSTPAVGTGRPE